MLEYNLGRMCLDGVPLGYHIREKAADYALRMMEKVKESAVYTEVLQKLPSPRVETYFLYIIQEEIYPFVLRGCVIQWYLRQGKSLSCEDRKVFLPHCGIFALLKECWDIAGVEAEMVHRWSLRRGILRNSIRAWVKEMVMPAVKKYRLRKKKVVWKGAQSRPALACHYTEGIEFSRRSDLHWYPQSGIPAENILVYFDRNSCAIHGGRPVPEEVVASLEKQGWQWVCLDEQAVESELIYWWSPPRERKPRFISKPRRECLDRWVMQTARRLLHYVHYWRQFYNWFNIKIHYITEEGYAENIAQAIAFDIAGGGNGALVGRQRSEFFLPAEYSLGFHPKHLFFTWNRRGEKYLTPNYNGIEYTVVTGCQNDGSPQSGNDAEKLRSGGADFVVAFFDSGHGPDVTESTETMAEYYNAFLQWVVEDSTVGLIIKPKKPKFFAALPAFTRELFLKAERTGRCLMVEDAWGRFPSESAIGADMAVGIASPTALVESVISGCRGIFYDTTNLKVKDYEFYQWGEGRLVFDDLQKIMEALKQYKEDPLSVSSLGDWSLYRDELCAFGDRKGAARMGRYIHGLLDAFEQGKNRTEALDYANAEYAQCWGSDKIIVLGEK